MRRVTIAAGAALAALLVLLWLTGAFGWIAAEAAAAQRGFQNAMARSLRALKAGEPGAVAALMATCFAYGLVHAAGPGHGKFLIGGYGAASRVGALRLSAVALASSLAQALSAVAFVYAGILLLGWTRAQMTGIADHILEPLSYGLIGLVGLWLAVRGLRHLSGSEGARAAAGHGHPHHHGDDHAHHHHDDGHGHVHGPDCGHAHAPTAAELARATGWRDVAALIGAVAVRPCTGAIFLLILTWGMCIPLLGIAGAFVMALGTSAIVIAVAFASVTLREGAFATLSESRVLTLGLPLAQVLAGGTIAAIATVLVLRAL